MLSDIKVNKKCHRDKSFLLESVFGKSLRILAVKDIVYILSDVSYLNVILYPHSLNKYFKL